MFPVTYHAKTDKGCILFTIACFSISFIITLPLNISIVASAVTGLLISGFLFLLQSYLNLKAKTEIPVKQSLVEKCKALNYGERKTEIAIKFFEEKMKTKEVWEWMCNEKHDFVEYDTVKQMKWRMKKELFK